MNKANTVRRVLALALVAAGAMLMAAACTNPVLSALTAMTSKSFGLAGTWGNSFYSMNMYLPGCYRLVINSDGTIITKNSSGTSDTGTYVINSVSISGNTRTYTFHTTAFYSYYVLARVTGTTLEIQISSFSYPSAINPSDPMNYATYTAQ